MDAGDVQDVSQGVGIKSKKIGKGENGKCSVKMITLLRWTLLRANIEFHSN